MSDWTTLELAAVAVALIGIGCKFVWAVTRAKTREKDDEEDLHREMVEAIARSEDPGRRFELEGSLGDRVQ